MREAAVGGDALGFFRPRRKPCFNRGAPVGREAAIGVRLQLGLAYRLVVHFTTLSFAPGVWPSIIARSFSRARDRRDMTVPIGMPRVRATSS